LLPLWPGCWKQARREVRSTCELSNSLAAAYANLKWRWCWKADTNLCLDFRFIIKNFHWIKPRKRNIFREPRGSPLSFI
jgi:hypothetical protein